MNTNDKAQYDAISKEYTDLVETDPAKRFVQYPSALKLLGDVSGKAVLDVGCGSGLFTRELARRGASVTAYDISPEQIANAQKAQGEEPLDIEYLVSNPQDFKTDKKFDKAVSVLVLHYAADKKYLEQFFASTSNALKEGGEFVCILVNPRFKRMGEVVYNRRFFKLGEGKMKADFFKNGEVNFSAEFSDFSAEDYERAATSGGFARYEWVGLQPDKEGVEKMGEDFWRGFEDDALFTGFIAYK